jgi:hypothetical protein
MELVLLLEGVHNDTGPIEGTPIVNSIDPICSSVTLLKGEHIILVDTGYRGYEEEIVSHLEAQGLEPGDIARSLAHTYQRGTRRARVELT